MDGRNGKTIRRCVQHIPQDSLLEVSYKGLKREAACLFGHKFQPNLMYSMKKKKRWELSSLMSKESYDEDQPITYSKHQCVKDTKPLLNIYLYDSISEKEVGNISVSNKKLQGKNFNIESAINQIENIHNYSKKEKEFFEKSKSERKKRKKSRKSNREMPQFSPEIFEQLPEKKDHIADKEKRADAVIINEYIHVNDITKISKIVPTHWITTKYSEKELSLLKRRKKKTIFSLTQDEIESDDELEPMEQYEFEEKKNPFILRDTDFLINENHFPKKKMRNKKIKEQKKYFIKTPNFENNESTIDIERTIIELTEDVLPCLTIECSVNDFYTDLDAVVKFCKCWISGSFPIKILIDFDEFLESKEKNFISLRPYTNINDDSMSVNVTFNLSDKEFDFNKILDQKFNSVKCLIVFMQSQIKQTYYKRSPLNRQIIILDGQFDGLINLWKTKKIESNNPLYLQHEEWSPHELCEDGLKSISLCTEYNNGKCEICFDDVLCIIMKKCGHILCENCVRSHIVCQLETGLKEMICPGDDCDQRLDASLILSLVSWTRYYKRLEILELTVINIGGCICSYCGAVLMNIFDRTTKKKLQMEYKCICYKNICSGCSQRQHFPSSCQEMSKYTVKMTELRDIYIIPEKVKPLIYTGRPCPTCFNFVVKEGGGNHLSCNCGAHFCWGCGDPMNAGRHLTMSFPCMRVTGLITQDFTKYHLIPDPSSIRPKLYCMALYHKINSSNYDSRNFYNHLQVILNLNVFPSDALQIPAQMAELSTIIEYIFVKAYQINKRQRVQTFRFLKGSVSTFLFYQDLIKSTVDTIYKDIKYKNCVNRTLQTNLQKLVKLSKELEAYLRRFSQVYNR